MRHKVRRLSANTTQRSTDPAGNIESFINMQPELGKQSFKPKRLGCTDYGWEKTGGTGSAKADKL